MKILDYDIEINIFSCYNIEKNKGVVIMEDFINKFVEAIFWFINLIKDLVVSVSGKETPTTETQANG